MRWLSRTGRSQPPRRAACAGGAAQAGTATDSLGVVRELSAGAQAQMREVAIADAVRAVLMYGVIVDHWASYIHACLQTHARTLARAR